MRGFRKEETVEHKIQFMKKVMEKDGHGVDGNLTTIQKQLNSPHVKCRIAPKLRDNISKRTPDDVRTREDAAARCTKVIKRRVLKKQPTKARAEDLVRCCLALGKKKAPKKPLTEFYVDGHFTEEICKNKLQRHCEEVYTDQEETK